MHMFVWAIVVVPIAYIVFAACYLLLRARA